MHTVASYLDTGTCFGSPKKLGNEKKPVLKMEGVCVGQPTVGLPRWRGQGFSIGSSSISILQGYFAAGSNFGLAIVSVALSFHRGSVTAERPTETSNMSQCQRRKEIQEDRYQVRDSFLSNFLQDLEEPRKPACSLETRHLLCRVRVDGE